VLIEVRKFLQTPTHPDKLHIPIIGGFSLLVIPKFLIFGIHFLGLWLFHQDKLEIHFFTFSHLISDVLHLFGKFDFFVENDIFTLLQICHGSGDVGLSKKWVVGFGRKRAFVTKIVNSNEIADQKPNYHSEVVLGPIFFYSFEHDRDGSGGIFLMLALGFFPPWLIQPIILRVVI